MNCLAEYPLVLLLRVCPCNPGTVHFYWHASRPSVPSEQTSDLNDRQEMPVAIHRPTQSFAFDPLIPSRKRHAIYASPSISSRNQTDSSLIHLNASLPQIRPGQINLCHQLLVRLRHIVECQNTPSQLEHEVCAERNKGPEG